MPSISNCLESFSVRSAAQRIAAGANPVVQLASNVSEATALVVSRAAISTGKMAMRPIVTAGTGITSIALPVGKSIINGVRNTVLFVKNHWGGIIAYIFAWHVIIACSGAFYGFQAVALPLTIGLGCGFVAGGIVGVIMVMHIDRENQLNGRNTGWGVLNTWINKLDASGTRQVVLAIAVTMLLAASVIYPYVLGASFGLLIGNHVVTKIGYKQNLGSNTQELSHRVLALEGEISRLRRIVEKNEPPNTP